MGRRIAWTVMVGLVLAFLGTPGLASAEGESGIALVQSKNLLTRTVTLEGNRVYKVTKSTEILDSTGAPLLLEDLATAPEVLPGMFEMTAEATVEFEATHSGGASTLTRIQVVGEKVE